jgi:hypothetical protein
MFNPPIDFDRRWARADRVERHGRTLGQAYELRLQAAKSAAICGECFRPLSPTDSVTMEARQVGGSRRANNDRWVRVPVCLLCTLDAIKESFFSRRYHRTRCRNCERPMRLRIPFGIYGEYRRPSLNACTCCENCARLAKNRRNKLRRRVHHQPQTCIKCGRAFTPKRADGLTCSNRCRQALHRERARAEVADSGYPLRKPTVRRERSTPR